MKPKPIPIVYSIISHDGISYEACFRCEECKNRTDMVYTDFFYDRYRNVCKKCKEKLILKDKIRQL